MAEIKEVFEDIKDAVGDKGLLILGAGVVGIFIFNLLNSKEEEPERLTTVTALTSYPDTVTNANVIIDTLQDSIDYAQTELEYQIQGMGDELTQKLETNFEATNDYINKGLESQTDMLEKQYSELNTSITNTQSMVKNTSTNIANSMFKAGEGLSLKRDVTATKGDIEEIKKSLESMTAKKPEKTVVENKVKVKTTNKLNTDTSIVDALKSAGIDSSMKNRKAIAKKNGISNYTGTASQNTKLLKLFKQGKLKY